MSAGSPHWAAQFVGLPWDPANQHCWAFCRHVWDRQFDLTVPAIPISGDNLRATTVGFARDPERALWTEVSDPRDGDAVVMARGRRDCHVGIWVAPDAVLHSIRPAAVYTTRNRLRDIGYRITGIYRRVC